jgi:hypothetical protein
MSYGQKTGGRQRGTLNRTTIERNLRAAHGVQAAVDAGVLPLDVMLARMRDEPLLNGQKPTDEQFEAACAAPHPIFTLASRRARSTSTPAYPA